MPFCLSCGRDKHQSEFHPDGRRASGFSDVCEECFSTAQLARHRDDKRRYRQEDPEKVRNDYRRGQLRRDYGITQERVDELLAKQGGCAICKSDHPNWDKGWHVDHDHSCCESTPICGGCIRGILCHRCNMMIGLAKDDPARLRAAADYLEGE